MIDYIYVSPLGEILGAGNAQDAGHIAPLSGAQVITNIIAHPGLNQYYSFAEGKVVPMPPKPSNDYIFDYQSKQWLVDMEGATARALQKRDNLLKDGPDRISPVWWDAMSQSQKDSWVSYRTALLDVPQQSGYPLQIIWPSKPSE
jgi:hypothetical protein